MTKTNKILKTWKPIEQTEAGKDAKPLFVPPPPKIEHYVPLDGQLELFRETKDADSSDSR
jgi:hypothetical protein